jgi:ATP-dependent Clp protease ATP-binding subunit ClpA
MFITENFTNSLGHANQMAHKFKHEYLVPETLALAILLSNDHRIVSSIQACKADVDEAAQKLRAFIHEHVSTGNAPSAALAPSKYCAETINRANEISHGSTRRAVDSLDYWIAFLEHPKIEGARILASLGITALRVKQFLAHGAQGVSVDPTKHAHPEGDVLSLYANCLTDLALDGKLDVVIGREQEILETSLDLSRRRKRNVLLVGEPGVGKTAVVEGLAQAIVDGKVGDHLKNKRVWSLNVGSVVAGTRYRGDFEERFQKIIQVCENNPAVILFVDEIHTLMGLGSGSSAMDAANLLKPALARGKIQLIGATTEVEARQLLEQDKALRRRFLRRVINEPSLEVAEQMVQAALAALASHHQVTFGADIAKAAVGLAKEHVRTMRLPDSALDLVDHLGSRHSQQPTPLSVEELTEAASRLFQLPTKTLSQKNATSADLKSKLAAQVFDQPKAIDGLYKAVIRAQAGLQDPEQPLGSFLFVGPTGVGKTEMAKQLAVAMALPFIKLDMTEYQEAHNTSRLIGSPPGYVGHNESGQLTDAFKRNPACVLLLDEFDKAHPAVANLFLQVLNDGTLTDGKGESLDFRKSFVIFTSNTGAHTIEKRGIGFTVSSEPTFDPKDDLKKSLPPEFRNRLSAIVPFQSLTSEGYVRVVRKILSILDARLGDRATLAFDDAFCAKVATQGTDKTMGARPLSRWIHEHVTTPLSEMVLASDFKPGATLHLAWSQDDTKVVFEKKLPLKLKKAKLKKMEPAS